jgi:pyruvate dehydrogenase E1 component alpha subunit
MTPPVEIQRLYLMLLIRRFEEQTFFQFTHPNNPISGFCGLCSGQEAVAVGAAESYQRGVDTFVGTFRGHGWTIALGTAPRAVAAEMFGRTTGCAKGRGGPLHLSDAATGNLGTYYVAGAQLPLGAGAAFAAAYRNTGGVAFVVMGDGAVDQGTFCETLNLASLLRLPALIILEDNGIALGTKLHRHSAETDLVKRGSCFGMPARGLDGNDVEAVASEVRHAADRARAGEGPTLLVARTFRLRGFTMSDPLRYRTREEQAAAIARDPIRVYANRLLEHGLLEAAALVRLERKATDQVIDAFNFAHASPNPTLEERFDNVLSENYPFPTPKPSP